MEILIRILENWFPTLVTGIVFYGLYVLSKKLLDRQAKGKTDKALIKSIVLFLIAFIGILSVILALPMETEQKGQLTSLIGIVLSAVLGLSATTFIGNAFSGIALKMRNSFKPGDFIEVNGIFGRVTEQGLFHTEIQTIDRDLTTLPNMSLANNSVKVTRQSGTIISVECSLGYDVNRIKIEEALLKAAKDCGLIEPFVHIISLGDFSIVYRVHGLLENIKSIVSSRSRLTGHVIDSLHQAGIEIVSPSFMNQKQVGDTVFIPKKHHSKTVDPNKENLPENIIFDKAEEAEGIEKKKALLADVEAKIKKGNEELKEIDNVEQRKKIEEKIEKTKELKEKIVDNIDAKVDKLDQTN